jgi:hypothetical protein
MFPPGNSQRRRHRGAFESAWNFLESSNAEST